MEQDKLSDKELKVYYNEYMKRYRKRNKIKVLSYNLRYYLKKNKGKIKSSLNLDIY